MVYRYHLDTKQSGVIVPVIARIMFYQRMQYYLLIDKKIPNIRCQTGAYKKKLS